MHKFLATLALFFATGAFAAVDVNKATEADLDGIKGLGPSTTRAILAERAKGDFKTWQDLIARVKGIRPASAAKLSAAGLRVGTETYAAP